MKIKPTIDEIQKFSFEVEELVWKFDISYLDAIMMYCDDTGLEFDVAAKLISSSLKEKLQEESEDNNLIKRSSKLIK